MLKILLVDDEPSAIKLLTYIIEHRYKEFEIVGTAENGQEGLEKIALLKPNIVITDVKMPIMDGIELAAHIKQDYPNIYCIIASGYDDFEYARGALKSGVVDYLLKPINAASIFSQLSKSSSHVFGTESPNSEYTFLLYSHAPVFVEPLGIP